MNRTTIIMLTGSLNIGGTERNILQLARRLDPERFQVEVWSEYEGEPIQAELRACGIPCRSLKASHSLGLPLLERIFSHNLPYQRRLFRLLRSNRDGIVHAFGFPMAYYAVLLGRLAGCRNIVFAVQDWDVWKKSGAYALLDRLCSRLAARVIADGEGARRLAVSRQGMDAGKVVTICDGVDVEELRPRRPAAEVRREIGRAPERPTVGVIARLDLATKGQDVFLRALPLISQEHPDAQFVLVGDGPDRQRVEEIVRALPERARPALAGFRGDLADLIRMLDILVIPSRWESVPKILLEAMWLGRAVVATRVGDMSEVLDETCGAMIRPDDAEALAAAVSRLLADADRRALLGERSHDRIVARGLTLDASIRRYEELYTELAER